MAFTMSHRFQPHKGRVVPNFLARDAANAREVYEASRKTALIGVMTAQFDDLTVCIDYVRELLAIMPAISVGLGDGDPSQWSRVVEVAQETDPGHVNQVFPVSGFTVGTLRAKGLGPNIVNALIRPTGTQGKVIISTGPASAEQESAVVDAETAAAMLADADIPSVKFFPIAGHTKLPEVTAMAKAAADRGIPIFEPTGGLSEKNVATVVQACLDAGSQWVIPHLYSSMVDKQTGLTQVDKVEQVMAELDRTMA